MIILAVGHLDAASSNFKTRAYIQEFNNSFVMPTFSFNYAIFNTLQVNATKTEVLQWFPGEPTTGLLLFFLGVFGALVTIYFYKEGDLFPAMGSAARIKSHEIAISQLKKRVDELRTRWDAEIKDLNAMIEQYDKGDKVDVLEKKIEGQKVQIEEIAKRVRQLEEDLGSKERLIDSERKSVLTTGMIFYVFLGGMFATVLGKDFLQAIIIGAGWTSFVSVLGLKKEQQTIRELREEAEEGRSEGQEKLQNIIDDAQKKINLLQSELDQVPKKLKDQYTAGFSEALRLAKEET